MKANEEHYWLWVVCILGIDYFSTLAYQPSITYHVAPLIGPFATVVVVLVTLFGALPVYCYLAGRSPAGQGSLGIVEKLIRGWRGKTLVLILLGFAATDFTMLKSLSLADATVHVVSQQDGARIKTAQGIAAWCKDCARAYLDEESVQLIDEQLVVTVVLGIVAFIFWYLLRKGFSRNVVVLAVPLVGSYLLMTGILIAGGLWTLQQHPHLVEDWLSKVHASPWLAGQIDNPVHGNEKWSAIIFWSLLALPNLALGLSGFELSMILMPQVQGKPNEEPPTTRIGNTRKVLVLAAMVMSVLLLGSVLVTTLLIPESAFAANGPANNRALAYLAHGEKLTLGNEALLPICGVVFGTMYDILTVLILCLAGTSVMTALAVLLPQFLLRFGMEFRWTNRWGILLMVFAGINLAVTLWFHADVDDQRGAYATGVLVLISCAAAVSLFEIRREYRLARRASSAADTTPRSRSPSVLLYWLKLAFFGLITVIFGATLLSVVVRSWSGIGIALCFIVAILAMSIFSRAWRADELRTLGFQFKNEHSKFLWNSLRLTDFPILVPIRPGRETFEQKEEQIRTAHHLMPEADIVFLEVCVDDPSDFFQELIIEVVREGADSRGGEKEAAEGVGTSTDEAEVAQPLMPPSMPHGYRYVIRVTNGVSVAHAIAAIALEMSRHSKPPALHFGWPELDILSASWSYLAFGEGNIPWKVRELIQLAEKDSARQPRVIVG